MKRWGVVVLLVSSVAWAGNPLDDAKQELLLGDQARGQGNYEVALAHYNAARLLVPDRPGPYASLGIVYAEMGKCPEAVDAFGEYYKRLKKEPNPEAAAANDRCKAILAREADEKRVRDEAERARQAAADEERRRQQVESDRRAEEDRQRQALQASEQRRQNRIAEAKRQEDEKVDSVIRMQKVSICDPVTNPSAVWKSGYWFCTAEAAITENEFLRRYENTTGSRENHYAMSVRNRTSFIIYAAFVVVGAGLTGYGFATVNRPCDMTQDKTDPSCQTGGMFDSKKQTVDTVSLVLGTVGAAAMLVGGVFMLLELGKMDGQPVDHTLSRADAERLAQRYNQALERRARQSLGLTSERPVVKPKVTVLPFFGGTSLGVVGRF
jgi:hypothetical protein